MFLFRKERKSKFEIYNYLHNIKYLEDTKMTFNTNADSDQWQTALKIASFFKVVNCTNKTFAFECYFCWVTII